MHRYLIAAVLTASALYGDAVTITSCTSGAITVSPCPGSYSFPGGIDGVLAGADASDSGIVPGVIMSGSLPSISGQTLSAAAAAIAHGSATDSVSAFAEGSAFNTYNTGGPVGPGYMQFDVQLDHAHGGYANVEFSDGVHDYLFNLNGGSTPSTYCNLDGCAFSGTVPITLGVDFSVTALASAGEAYSAGASGIVGHGSDDAILTFRLLADDGTTPVAFYAAPEPSTACSVLLGTFACCLFWRFRNQRSTSTIIPGLNS